MLSDQELFALDRIANLYVATDDLCGLSLGVIIRLIDLGFVTTASDGIKQRYIVTGEGEHFLAEHPKLIIEKKLAWASPIKAKTDRPENEDGRMVELNDVMMEEYMYPCVHYALKRIGSVLSPSETMKLPRQEFKSVDDLERGDIVVWVSKKRKPWIEMVIGMREGLGPVMRRFKDDFHVAVYEGDGMFSDVTLRGKQGPTVSVFPLTDWHAPDEVIPHASLL